jgi:hypothetical protein
MDCIEYLINIFSSIIDDIESIKNWMNMGNFRRNTIVDKYE